MKEISIHVGQKIRLFRKMKGMTIEVFAGMIGKSKATVSKYEMGIFPSMLKHCLPLHRHWKFL